MAKPGASQNNHLLLPGVGWGTRQEADQKGPLVWRDQASAQVQLISVCPLDAPNARLWESLHLPFSTLQGPLKT